MATFIAELRQLSKFCEYWEKLDDTLCDRSVGGIRQLSIKCVMKN